MSTSVKVPTEPAPATAPQPDDSVVQNEMLKEYAQKMGQGANFYTNRLGNTGGVNSVPNYGAAFTAKGAGSSIITGKAA